jgi:hypothetical protein
MEQMMNLRLVGDRDPVEGEGASPWRSLDSVLSGLVARAEAQRAGAPRDEDVPFAPAWAAE